MQVVRFVVSKGSPLTCCQTGNLFVVLCHTAEASKLVAAEEELQERRVQASTGIVASYSSSVGDVRGTGYPRPLQHWGRGLESHTMHRVSSAFLGYFPYFEKDGRKPMVHLALYLPVWLPVCVPPQFLLGGL